MSIATYQISTKTLILSENGKILGSWHAVSGGAKNTKPLPTGIYTKITDPIGGIRKDQTY